MQVYFNANQNLFCRGTRFETQGGGNSEIATYCKISIQLFREMLSVKSTCDNPERYCGFF